MYNESRGKVIKKDYFINQQGKLIEAIDKHNQEVRAPYFNNDFSKRT